MSFLVVLLSAVLPHFARLVVLDLASSLYLTVLPPCIASTSQSGPFLSLNRCTFNWKFYFPKCQPLFHPFFFLACSFALILSKSSSPWSFTSPFIALFHCLIKYAPHIPFVDPNLALSADAQLHQLGCAPLIWSVCERSRAFSCTS